jgi:hypothetical protein
VKIMKKIVSKFGFQASKRNNLRLRLKVFSG